MALPPVWVQQQALRLPYNGLACNEEDGSLGLLKESGTGTRGAVPIQILRAAV